jgi:hypothetical protein
VARLRQLDLILQTMSGLVISLGRSNPAIRKPVREFLELQESTLLALFQAYCVDGQDLWDQRLASVIWQVITLVDNLKDLVGEFGSVSGMAR